MKLGEEENIFIYAFPVPNTVPGTGSKIFIKWMNELQVSFRDSNKWIFVYNYLKSNLYKNFLFLCLGNSLQITKYFAYEP